MSAFGDAEEITGLYRVDTQATAVEISFGAALRIQGEMFLRPSIVTLSGIESIADRMNDREAFFPLRVPDPSPTTLLVGKTQVRYVSADRQPLSDDALRAGEGTMELLMTIALDDGETLTGIVHAVMPQGKRRALDFLNRENGLFMPFFVEQRQYVINRSFIRFVSENRR